MDLLLKGRFLHYIKDGQALPEPPVLDLVEPERRYYPKQRTEVCLTESLEHVVCERIQYHPDCYDWLNNPLNVAAVYEEDALKAWRDFVFTDGSIKTHMRFSFSKGDVVGLRYNYTPKSREEHVLRRGDRVFCQVELKIYVSKDALTHVPKPSIYFFHQDTSLSSASPTNWSEANFPFP